MNTLPARARLWRPATAPSIGLVALGAALWGTDPWIRSFVARELPAPTIVFVEHIVPVLLMLPFVVRGLAHAARVLGPRDWLALIVLGCGSSALATLLFTHAFVYGSYTTPALLQQVQPLFAVAAAAILLRERIRPFFGFYLVAGLAGAYLIAFPNPLSVPAPEWKPALLALGAALLWGLGTVLGRHLSAAIPFGELTALRLVFGLVAVTAVAVPAGDLQVLAHLDGGSMLALLGLALVPGLASLLIYYRGLRGTPASAATLAELAFPVTTLILAYVALGEAKTLSQWAGVVVVAATVTVMGLAKPGGTRAAVEVDRERVGSLG